MQMIQTPPACPGLPARTMPALDLFFEESAYVIWYTAQQASYIVVRDAYKAADLALKDAITAYNIQKAVRDVQYCDWKTELEAACAAFDVCFSQTSEYYTNVLVPHVTKSMKNRIEVNKAGETIIHQVRFLLGVEEEQEGPPIDTSRYEIDFPDVPAKGLCDLSPLGSDKWVPTVTCSSSHRLVDGCSTAHELFAHWGEPRLESDDESAGEAICCNDEGVGTRNIKDNVGLFNQGLSHTDCTTTSGGPVDSTQHTPSHTFFQAQTVCANAGLRLCRTQAEIDTSCHTGCSFDFSLVWMDSK